jgi:hypothetical protein
MQNPRSIKLANIAVGVNLSISLHFSSLSEKRSQEKTQRTRRNPKFDSSAL